MRCSARELIFLVLVVGSLSVLLTYHLTWRLPRRDHGTLRIRFDGRLEIFRSVVVAAPPYGEDKREGIEAPSYDGDKREGMEAPPYGEDEREGMEAPSYGEDTHHGLQAPPIDEDTHQGLEDTDLKKPGGGRKKQRQPRQREPLAELLQKVKQLERDQLGGTGVSRVVAVRGNVTEGSREETNLFLYLQSLQRVGYVIILPDYITTRIDKLLWLKSYRRADVELSEWQGWDLLLCVGTVTAGNLTQCLNPDSLHHLQPHQQVNIIPALQGMLWGQDKLCLTMGQVKHIPVVISNSLSLPCFILPAQYEAFLTLYSVQGPGAHWVVKPLPPIGSDRPRPDEPEMPRPHLLQPIRTDTSNFNRHQRSVIQQYQGSPLLLFGMPLSLQVFVLVTSVLPLAAYIHSQGLAQSRHDYQHNFMKMAGRTWSLDQWHQRLSQTYSHQVADITFKNMYSVIVQTLLVSDNQLRQIHHKRRNCFQLLEFEVIFNSSFHPIITEVHGHPDLQQMSHIDEHHSDQQRNPVVEDTVAMVTSRLHVADDVTQAIAELNLVTGGVNCGQNCLTTYDIIHMLSLRRQSLSRGGFRQLYPTPDSDRYWSLLQQLNKLTLHGSNPASSTASAARSSLINKHSIFTSLVKYFHNIEYMDDSYDDVNNADVYSEKNRRKYSSQLVQNVLFNTVTEKAKEDQSLCDEGESSLPLLDAIHTEPRLNITPHFSATITDYYSTVPYNIYLVKVWAYAKSCYSEARLDAKYGLSRPSNYTLGVGDNTIHIQVVDVRHSEPWIVATYTLHLTREHPGHQHTAFSSDTPHTVCSLLQECDFRYLPSAPCGLQVTPHNSWSEYKHHTSTLPVCNNEHVPGRWMVPCDRCDASEACYWEVAVWQPETCSHPSMPRDQLKRCLAGKQVLFIGDSTNRGIMHYLMEQVNGSLTHWDKTHDTQLYSGLNQDQTTVGFAYYPQFWLPAGQRPVFDKALAQLLKQAAPLENNPQTVVVVGGVHWLATHHLTVITSLLTRQGLTKIQVIMKGLGAGFHQPVDGLHCLSEKEQRKLVIHNNGLCEYGRQQGFRVVDTFNMTMARYKHFLQGKCACHFHRVKEVLPSFTQYLKITSQQNSGLTDMPIHYHVEGPINQAYSELLINQICDYKGENSHTQTDDVS